MNIVIWKSRKSGSLQVQKHEMQLDTDYLWWIGMRSHMVCLVCYQVLLCSLVDYQEQAPH